MLSMVLGVPLAANALQGRMLPSAGGDFADYLWQAPPRSPSMSTAEEATTDQVASLDPQSLANTIAGSIPDLQQAHLQQEEIAADGLPSRLQQFPSQDAGALGQMPMQFAGGSDPMSSQFVGVPEQGGSQQVGGQAEEAAPSNPSYIPMHQSAFSQISSDLPSQSSSGVGEPVEAEIQQDVQTGDVSLSAVHQRLRQQVNSGPTPLFPFPTPAGHCSPQCFYKCQDVRCDEVCEPVCKAATCETRCSRVDLSKCTEDCTKPHCRIDCPRRQCASASCPFCKTKCGKPQCLLRCPKEQPCHTVCEHPVCTWKCRAPDRCPRPKCQMICESPPRCMSSTFKALPGLAFGEVRVQRFQVSPEEAEDVMRNEYVEPAFGLLRPNATSVGALA